MQARLSFQNLNTFAVAAQAASFQRAAEILHVTPSAVSHQIRNLESMLGYPLFERLDKQVRLTDRGRQLYQEIREPIEQLHRASRNALRGAEENNLALTVAPVFATRWLLPRLAEFRTRHPEISLSVIATTELVNFEKDSFDAAIRMGDGHWDDIHARRLFDTRMVAVCRPDMIERNGGRRFTIEQLAQQTLIDNSYMPHIWREWLDAAGAPASTTLSGIELQGNAQVLEGVEAGGVIGLVDEVFIQQDLAEGRLAIACDYVLTGRDGYFLTYPESRVGHLGLQLFEQWLFSQTQPA